MKRMLVLNFGNTAKRRLLFGALIVLINLITSYSTFAQVSPCDSNIVTERVTYFPISGTLTTNATDPRVSPGDSDYRVRLRGSVHYKDPGSGTLKNRPVLIFLHGHEQTRPEACRIVKYFTLEQNWVVFTPLWRGYSLDVADNDDPSDDIRSTGIYIDDFVDACDRTQELATFSDHLPHLYCGANQCRPSIACGLQTRRSAVELEYLNQQRIDVREAITYIKSRGAIADGHVNPSWKLADPKRIVILGHSYGGALTVFTK